MVKPQKFSRPKSNHFATPLQKARLTRHEFGEGSARSWGKAEFSTWWRADIHRSAGSRELFGELAATLAADSGTDCLTALHLLAAIVKSPAPGIAQSASGRGRFTTPTHRNGDVGQVRHGSSSDCFAGRILRWENCGSARRSTSSSRNEEKYISRGQRLGGLPLGVDGTGKVFARGRHIPPGCGSKARN